MWQVTTHAADRWCERVEPGASRAAASARLLDLLPRARHVGQARTGQAYSLPWPGDPVVVARTGDGVRIVVTVVTGDQWRLRRALKRAKPPGRETARRERERDWRETAHEEQT